MKKLFVLLTLALSLSSFTSAHARSMIGAQTANFYRIDYTSNTGVKFVTGNVTLDYINGKIKVFLMAENNCPRNAFCFVGPFTESLTAPMTERNQVACGQIVYKAEKNDMPVDGIDLSITVTDMTHLVCRIRPMAPTVVKITKKFFDRIKGEEVKKEGLLFANPLSVIAPLNE